MNEHVAVFFQYISIVYYKYRFWLFGFCTLLCFFIITLSILKLKKKIDLLDLLKNSIIKIIIFAAIGLVFNYTGVTIDFKVYYMPLIIFLLIFTLLCITLIFDCLKFNKNKKTVLKNNLRFLNILIYGEILLLSTMMRLEFIEASVAIIVIITIHLVSILIAESEKKLHINNLKSINGDEPIIKIEQLFPSRKRQLLNFCNELNIMAQEPFAIMISGEWGYGKTSFINTFIDKNKDDEFIKVEAGFDCEPVKLLDDIAIQLESIFEKNSIFTGRNSSIEKYFSDIETMVGNAGYNFASKFIERANKRTKDGYSENKQKLNEELLSFYNLTHKRIFIIIDNLDRTKNDVRDKLFEVIRESVYLNNCITIFLTDSLKFQTEHMNSNFIEKYINKNIQLCPVEFDEIVQYYLPEFLTDEFLVNKSEYVKSNAKLLKNNLLEKTNQIYQKLNENLIKMQEEIKKDNLDPKLIENYNSNINKIKEILNILNIRLRNPRKIKRFLFDGIQVMLNIIDTMWFSDENYENNQYSKYDWLQDILEVAYIKYFLYEEYERIISYGNLTSFKRCGDTIVEQNIISDLGLYPDSGKEEVIELIIYKLYSLNSRIDKSKQQNYLEELINKRINENHIKEYIEQCLGWNIEIERINIILEYLEEHSFQGKKEALLELMNLAESKSVIYKDDSINIYNRLKILIDSGIKEGIFRERDINIINAKKKSMQTRFIWENRSAFSCILGMIFNKKDVDTYFDKNIDSIDLVFKAINELNARVKICDFLDYDNHLLAIERFFINIESILL